MAKTKQAEQPEELLPPENVAEQVEEDSQPFFPLVVSSFVGKLPGEPGYEMKKDRMLMGFQFGQKTLPSWVPKDTKLEDITAYDFLTSPSTGMRKGQSKKPWGTGSVDLTKGIGEYDQIPPVEIWSRGAWLGDVVWDPRFEYNELPYQLKQKIDKLFPIWPKSGVPEEIYSYWICPGEGTPQNHLYRLYELPREVAGRTKPQHPIMWPERLKKKTWGGTTTIQATKAYQQSLAPAKPVLPYNVRVRCGECGHWFKVDDLKAHNNVCGKGEETDWAAMCADECGCRTLDEVCKPKAGFPRKKPEATAAKTEEPTPTA